MDSGSREPAMGAPRGGALDRRRSLGSVTRADRPLGSLARSSGCESLADVRVSDLAIDVVPRFDARPNGGAIFGAVGAVRLIHVPARVVAAHRVSVHAAQPELGAIEPHPGPLAGAVARADPDRVGVT